MFNTDVEIDWPEEVEEVKDNKIRTILAIPPVGSLSLNKLDANPVQFIMEKMVTASPNYNITPNSYSRNSPRSRIFDLAGFTVESVSTFATEHYQRVYDAACTHFEDQAGRSLNSYDDPFRELWTTFKSACKNGVAHYSPKAGYNLRGDLVHADTDDGMELLMRAFSEVKTIRDSLNDEQVANLARLSIVKFWLKRYKAEAEKFAFERTVRTPTRKEARALTRKVANAVRNAEDPYGTGEYMTLRGMPKVCFSFNPMRVALVHPRGRVECESKSVEHLPSGERAVKRVQYSYGWLPSDRRVEIANTYYTYDEGLEAILDKMVKEVDYITTCKELAEEGTWL